MFSFCLQVCFYIHIKQHARSTQIITDILCVSHIFWLCLFFFHYFLCHFFLIKHSLFLLEFLILFYSVVSKVFKCSKSTRYLATQWFTLWNVSQTMYVLCTKSKYAYRYACTSKAVSDYWSKIPLFFIRGWDSFKMLIYGCMVLRGRLDLIAYSTKSLSTFGQLSIR